MCILFVANRVHQDYPLMIVANRDEFFSRPTLEMHFWEDQQHILAGRDELAGGTWLGVNRKGRIAGITNVRAPDLKQAGARSRGNLISRWLGGEDSRAGFGVYLEQEFEAYNPFNLIWGDVDNLSIFSSVAPRHHALEAGFLAISNGHPSDSWPKMSRGTVSLENYLVGGGTPEADQLQQLMRDNSRVDWSSLTHSGIPLDYEEALSSIFVDAIEINGEIYGTRTTSVLTWDGGSFDFTEYNYGSDGEIRRTQEQGLEIDQEATGAIR